MKEAQQEGLKIKVEPRVINITPPNPPQIKIEKMPTHPNLPSFGFGKVKTKIETERSEMRPFKIIEKYKPSLFSLHTGLKMKDIGIKSELEKAVFRPIIPKFKMPKFKVKI